jgi:molecular chaperone Hsp33
MPRRRSWRGALPDLSPIEIAPTDDLIRPFQIDPFGLRGRYVRLGPALDRIIGRHGYPEPVARMLGEAIALAATLAGALKYEGVFTLQTKGDGPISMLVADVTSDGAIRGYAQFDAAALAARATIGSPVPRLLGAGYLAFTVDQGQHTERYQGIVELIGTNLAECVHHYFRQSEQIEVGLRVAASQGADGSWRAGALMLQRLPLEGGTESRLAFAGDGAAEAQDDGWRRALVLLGTCTDSELTAPDLDSDALLFRLFHEDGVRVYPAQPLTARCRCSRERIEDVLLTLPPDDLRHLVVDGKAGVTCEFCSTFYEFSEAEIETLAARER